MLGALPIPELRESCLAGIPALTDESLFAQTGVRIMFTGRAGGVSEGVYASLNCYDQIGDDERLVERNLQLMREAAGAAHAPIVVPKQVHGTEIVCASAANLHPEADGVLSGSPGIGVLLNSADCLLLIIVSPSRRFAIAHAGWRGVLAHIASKAALALARDDDAAISDFNAYIGPHIHPECFEVGDEVLSSFRDEFGAGCISEPRQVSLAAVVSADLEHAGFDASRIADADICTKCHPERFHSYRATSGACGRNAAFAIQAR